MTAIVDAEEGVNLINVSKDNQNKTPRCEERLDWIREERGESQKLQASLRPWRNS